MPHEIKEPSNVELQRDLFKVQAERDALTAALSHAVATIADMRVRAEILHRRNDADFAELLALRGRLRDLEEEEQSDKEA